jgi:hypothetical protein
MPGSSNESTEGIEVEHVHARVNMNINVPQHQRLSDGANDVSDIGIFSAGRVKSWPASARFNVRFDATRHTSGFEPFLTCISTRFSAYSPFFAWRFRFEPWAAVVGSITAQRFAFSAIVVATSFDAGTDRGIEVMPFTQWWRFKQRGECFAKAESTIIFVTASSRPSDAFARTWALPGCITWRCTPGHAIGMKRHQPLRASIEAILVVDKPVCIEKSNAPRPRGKVNMPPKQCFVGVFSIEVPRSSSSDGFGHDGTVCACVNA